MKTWNGSIESIELDWHEGVFVESSSSPHSDPRLPAGVYYDAHCCLCDWAYFNRKDGNLLASLGRQIAYGRGTPDIEEILGWVRNHRREPFHVEAVMEFRRTKRQSNGGGGCDPKR